jgi:glycyl-tRNA synthetase
MDNKMEKLVSLCKRRGFLFQSSEIYGGLNGFWDYGPLGVELKRNVKDAWWRDMVTMHDEMSVHAGAPQTFSMVGIDTSLIMHPQVWKCSGHYDLFHDYMADCRETKKRYRFDHLKGRWATYREKRVFITTDQSGDDGLAHVHQRALDFFNVRKSNAEQIEWGTGPHGGLKIAVGGMVASESHLPEAPVEGIRPITDADSLANVLAPDAKEPGTLTEPREFNLMFKTTIGALAGEEGTAFLRPETAQGMFVNFKNVVDSSRVKVPFGIAQVGKSFRNEITPRNFTFRSREFEQMEMEFFCHPSESFQWYQYWRDRRYAWYLKLGIDSSRIILRDHTQEELAHYSVGTADIEYAFPFCEPGSYGELEGVAHRGDFDLRSHSEGKLRKGPNGLEVETTADGTPKYRGSGKDLSYFDDQSRERFMPHVIEPAAGADRATLAFLCEAYHEDEQPDENGAMQVRVVLRLHPRLAPIKVAIFPLIKKQGMPEIASEIYREFKAAGVSSTFDQQAAIGRRYRRQDEIGTPYCITVDGDTLTDQTVTIRDRDSLKQWRVHKDKVVDEILGLLRKA